MKRIYLVIFSLLFAAAAFGQAQKTFVKSFMINDNAVYLLLDGEVEVKEWDETFVRVHTNVTLENANNTVLKSLLVQGRYDLKQGLKNGIPSISAAQRSANIKYRGQILEETVTYTVFVPRFTTPRGTEEVKEGMDFSSK